MHRILLFLIFLVAASSSATIYRWVPAIGSTFYFQISGTLNHRVIASVYFVDLFDNISSTLTINDLKASGRRIVCRIQTGVYKRSHPD